MVTAETTKEILFLLKDCLLCKFVEFTTKFLPLPPKIIKLENPNSELLKNSPTKTLPILKTGDDFITGILPIIKYLYNSIPDDYSDGVIFDVKKILLGKNLKEEAKVDMWLNFILNNIYPSVIEINILLYGKKKYNFRTFDLAVCDLCDELFKVNEQLKLNTFLTANNVQLSDLMLASALFNCYNDIFTKDKWEMYPNVIRVFKFVANMKQFKDVFGVVKKCKKLKEPEKFVGKVEEKKEDVKNEKDKKEEKGEEGGKKKKNKKNKK